MTPSFPLLPTLLFEVLVLALVMFAIFLAGKTAPEQRLRVAFVLGAWLAATAVLSFTPFLHDFSAVPPRLFFLIAALIVALVFIQRTAYIRQMLERIAPSWLVGFQVFRVLMEIILWQLHTSGIVPVQMTFEGRNFDILAGLTAPIVAYLLHTRRISPIVAIVWNYASLGLLLNIIVVSVLSAPSPFRVFWNEPANTFIAYFPFVWLPVFVVAIALWGHWCSLRQLFALQRT